MNIQMRCLIICLIDTDKLCLQEMTKSLLVKRLTMMLKTCHVSLFQFYIFVFIVIDVKLVWTLRTSSKLSYLYLIISTVYKGMLFLDKRERDYENEKKFVVVVIHLFIEGLHLLVEVVLFPRRICSHCINSIFKGLSTFSTYKHLKLLNYILYA